MFRSLFSWIPLCRRDLENDGELQKWVSILVLLDTALPEESLDSRESLPRGFDPCSPGYRSAGPQIPDAVLTAGPVSILVLLDTALPVWRRKAKPAHTRLVSILVLLDTALPASSTSRSTGAPSRFRSLFSWIPLCRRYMEPDSLAELGVSILVLLDTALPDGPLQSAHSVDARFRSLFSWIPLCRVADRRPSAPRTVFRSLFSWIPLCRLHAAASRRHRLDVSILVLLDTALPEDFTSAHIYIRAPVSILVLLDTALPAP